MEAYLTTYKENTEVSKETVTFICFEKLAIFRDVGKITLSFRWKKDCIKLSTDRITTCKLNFGLKIEELSDDWRIICGTSNYLQIEELSADRRIICKSKKHLWIE